MRTNLLRVCKVLEFDALHDLQAKFYLMVTGLKVLENEDNFSMRKEC